MKIVSVICICYNHARFVREAAASVLAQTYPHIELILIDNHSTDGSREVISALSAQHPEITTLLLEENVGNCGAFNIGMRLAKGDFFIDLSADDVLLPHRVALQVVAFEQLPPDYGVVFSDCEMIDEHGERIGTHHRRDEHGNLTESVPSGDIYTHLLKSYVVCSPTMMIRRAVLEQLEGYDEALSYEDFDFFVRAGRHYRFHFLEEITTRKRVLRNSHLWGFYLRKHNPHLRSTVLVFEKAMSQNRTEAEKAALLFNIRYHLRVAALTDNRHEAALFFGQISRLSALSLVDYAWYWLSKMPFSLHSFYVMYLKYKLLPKHKSHKG